MRTFHLLKSMTVAVLLMAGCKETAVNPEGKTLDAISATKSTGPELALNGVCPPQCEGKVTAGSLLVQGPGDLNITFSFHGDNSKASWDKGQFNYVDHTAGLHYNGNVTCVAIKDFGGSIGKIARIVGRFIDENDNIKFAVWYAKDNGEPGHKEGELADQISWPRVFNSCPGCECDFKCPDVAWISITTGNIQFHKPNE